MCNPVILGICRAQLDAQATIPHLTPQMLAAQLSAVQLESIAEGSEEGESSRWSHRGISSSIREEGGAAAWDLPNDLASSRDQREGGQSGIPDVSVSLSGTALPQPVLASVPPSQDETMTLSTSLGTSSPPAARDRTPTAGAASELLSGGDQQRLEEAPSGPAAIAARYLPSDNSSVLSKLTELAAQGKLLAAAAADGSSSSAVLSEPGVQWEPVRSSFTSTRLPSISSSRPAGEQTLSAVTTGAATEALNSGPAAEQTLSAVTTGAATEALEGKGTGGPQPQGGAGPDADRQQAVQPAGAPQGQRAGPGAGEDMQDAAHLPAAWAGLPATSATSQVRSLCSASTLSLPHRPLSPFSQPWHGLCADKQRCEVTPQYVQLCSGRYWC